MSRFLLLPVMAALALLSPLRAAAAQTSVYIPGGVATLSDQGANGQWSILDLQLTALFGPTLAVPIQFDRYGCCTSTPEVLTPMNGATFVGFGPMAGYAGPYILGELDYFMNPTTLVGGISGDPTNYPIISNRCEPLAPSGYKDDGTPYFGAVWAETPGYMSTCAPGSYVEVSMTIPHATGFIGLEPVTATPEPSTLALMATGLAGLGGFVRRRRSRASAASSGETAS